jgi:hypothetical protein
VTVRFLADENLDTDIIQGLRAREPAIDILDVKTAGLRGTARSSAPRTCRSAGSRFDHLRPEHDDTALSRSPRCRESNARRVYPSAAGERYWRDHRVVASGVGRVASRRVAESDRVSALQVMRRLCDPVLQNGGRRFDSVPGHHLRANKLETVTLLPRIQRVARPLGPVICLVRQEHRATENGVLNRANRNANIVCRRGLSPSRRVAR